ncbi:MAG: hypothetical protein CSB01_00285 [Bacteroidia bacterium]|nr:MAG: hypothetical protein CSB01_00285 [Bacteroidia bacterium]
MTIIIKRLAGIFVLLCSFLSVNSQHFTSSPYSRYGFGDLIDKGFGQNSAMGGLAIGIQNPTNLNIINPASYTAIPMQTFTFEVGLFSKYTRQKTNDWTQEKTNVNLNYLAMAFPITKWLKASAGLLPYSCIGYDIKSYKSLFNKGYIVGEYTSMYKGKGGINQVYFGNSIAPIKGFSFGYNISYLFGTLDQSYLLDFSDNADESRLYIEKNTRVHDFMFNLGAQYSTQISDKIFLTLGAIWEKEQDITAFRQSKAFNSQHVNGIALPKKELKNDTIKNGKINLPEKVGFGFSLKSSKILFGVDYTMQDWTEARFFGEKDNNLAKYTKLAAGFEYTPDYASIKYYNVIRYRVGAHMTDTYVKMDNGKGGNEQIKNYGITFGVGLPLKNSNTIFNVAFEFGKRGTTDFNLLDETYGIIRLNASLHDIWFLKYRFQ